MSRKQFQMLFFIYALPGSWLHTYQGLHFVSNYWGLNQITISADIIQSSETICKGVNQSDKLTQ